MATIDIEYFRAVQNGIGAHCKKDIKLAEARQRFSDKFGSSFNYEYDATRNDEPQNFIIAPSHADKSSCSIFTKPGEELNMGDMIFWHGIHWLTVDIDFSDSISRSGKIQRCNRTIKWQNPETKEIIERWCIAEKPYTSNIDKGKEVNTSNREFKIQIPFDDETALVDIDKRFLLESIGGEPKAYKCTCVDTVTNKYQDIEGGFLIWNLTQCEYNRSTDNAELMIADYEDNTEPVQGVFDITYAGKPEVRIGGSAKTFTAEAPDAVWTVDAVPEIMPYLTVTTADNKIKVKAQRENSIVGTSVNLTAQSSSGASRITVKIVGGM